MQPIISETDYNALGQMLIREKTRDTKFLRSLLRKLRIVKESEVPKKTIRLNSIVVIWNSLLNKLIRLRIVLPNKADLKTRQVSVLAPISLALIGHKENDTLVVNNAGIEKYLRVIQVTNE